MFVNCENQTVLSNLFTVAPNKCVYTKETLACREKSSCSMAIVTCTCK